MNSHYSFLFKSIDAKATINDEELNVYANKLIAKPLADKIVARQEQGSGNGGVLVRLKVRVTNQSFEYGEYQRMVELIDWQYLNGTRTGWTPWLIHPAK